MLAILFFAALAAAATGSIKIKGNADDELINNFYQAFGGTWDPLFIQSGRFRKRVDQ
jgi:hypothetical protein